MCPTQGNQQVRRVGAEGLRRKCGAGRRRGSVSPVVGLAVCACAVLLAVAREANAGASPAVGPAERAASRASVELMGDIDRLRQDVAIIRRDQLTYQMERDLLKDTYASNLETVNIVITLVLGVFSILGFLGVSRIMGLRKEFDDELKQMRDQRADHQAKFLAIVREQEDAKQAMERVVALSALQDKRLKILELIEKARKLYDEKEYWRALDYVAVALDMDPSDARLLEMKCQCHSKAGQGEEAVLACERLAALEPNDKRHVENLKELYLLTQNKDKYDALAREHPAALEEQRWFRWYWQALELYAVRDVDGMRAHVVVLANDAPKETQRMFGKKRWSLEEAKAISGRKNDPEDIDRLLYFAARALDGEISAEEMRGALGTVLSPGTPSQPPLPKSETP